MTLVTQLCVCRTPLHCAASCGNLKIAKLLVEHGAAVFARTMGNNEMAIDKCETIEGSPDAVHEYLSGECVETFCT
jgi:apoptosis-stimulating of p53 protein 1